MVFRALLLLSLSLFAIEAQNINCGPSTRRVVPVDWNKSFTFKSQRKGLTKYLPNTDCRVLYKQGPNCRTMKFSCTSVAVKAGWKRPAKPTSARYCWGDFMMVRRYGQKQRYCRQKKPEPEFNSTGAITVYFSSNYDQHVSTGSDCKIECIEDMSQYKGVVMSDYHPQPYQINRTAIGPGATSYRVYAPTGYVLKLKIKSFDVNPGDDFSLWGPTAFCKSAGNSQTFASGTPDCAAGQEYTTSLDQAIFNFEGYQGTAGTNTATGYKIVWTAVKDPSLRSLDDDYLDYDLEALEAEYSD